MKDCYSENCIRLIMCFINGQIEQQCEQDLPSDSTVPLLEYVEGYGIRQIQYQGFRNDPIYKLFYPEGQG